MAARLRERLGLDPRAEVELVRETADATKATSALDRLRELGRQALESPRSNGVGNKPTTHDVQHAFAPDGLGPAT